jgi:hypothetical protein
VQGRARLQAVLSPTFGDKVTTSAGFQPFQSGTMHGPGNAIDSSGFCSMSPTPDWLGLAAAVGQQAQLQQVSGGDLESGR